MRKLVPIFPFILMLLVQPLLAQQDDPLELVRNTADTVLKEVVASRETLDQDPALIYGLVSQHVLPYFDFASMTQSAMGKYWRRANAEQKAAVVDHFRELLVRTYGVALLNYSGEEITYLPVRPSDDPARATVQTRIRESKGGPEIPVDYRLQRDAGTWKVHDVLIDGISLVSNYRTSFASQIRRGGIDGLISQLAAQNQDNQG